MNKGFKKFMLTSASAAALLAAYPSLAPAGEALGLDTPAITAEAATNARGFIEGVMELPNVSDIVRLNSREFETARKEAQTVRSAYNRLSNSDKRNANVVKWEGYLTQKENALGNNFIAAVGALPSSSAISELEGSALGNTERAIEDAKSLYEALPANAKSNDQVSKWKGYLDQKEAALPDDAAEAFVNAVLRLPNLTQIAEMDTAGITATQAAARSARNLYNGLTAEDKADADVVRWEGYLSQKEEPVGLTFISQVGALPGVAQIAELDGEELAAVAADAETARASYEGLSDAAKADPQVVKWVGYLEQKEEAIADNQVEGLVVVNVTDITRRDVKLVIAAPEEDLLDVNVEVVDGKGNPVPTVATDIPAGRTNVSFDFVDRVDAEDLTGVWTVDGVEYNFDEFALVEDIVEAAYYGRQVDLLYGLREAGIVGVNEGLISEYGTAIDNAETPRTFADVQAIITQVNKDQGIVADGTEVLDALVDAESELAVYNVLRNNFEDVNTDWAPAYYAAFVEWDYTYDSAEDVEDALEEVQNLIYSVNHEQIAELDYAADTKEKQAAVTALYERWVEDYDEIEKEDLVYNSRLAEKVYDVEAAEANVDEAETENSLYDALEAYETAVERFNEFAEDEDHYAPLEGLTLANKAYYFEYSEAGTPQAIVNAGNEAAEADAEAAKDLAEAVEAAEEAQAAYLAAGGSEEDAVYTDVSDALETADDAEGVTELTEATLELEVATERLEEETDNLVEFNDAFERAEAAQAAYLAAGGSEEDEVYTKVSEAIEFTKEDGDASNLNEWTAELEDATAELVLVSSINNAETASGLEKELVKLGETSYNNLTRAQRLEVAGLFLDTIDENDYKASSEIAEDLGYAVGDYVASVSAVNEAVDTGVITAVADAIENLETDEFEALSASEQLDAAESVIENAPTSDNGDSVYRTIAQIVNNF